MKIIAQPLTLKEFKPFGTVGERKNSERTVINDGYARKYANICAIDNNDGAPKSVHIFVLKAKPLPVQISVMEKHPHWAQCFISCSNDPFVILVTKENKNVEPDIKVLKAFMTNGYQSIVYAKNVWHAPLISLKNGQEFIVIDGAGINQNQTECIEYTLPEPIHIAGNSKL